MVSSVNLNSLINQWTLTHYKDLLDEQVEQSLLLGLVDIIFAYAYNYRTTESVIYSYERLRI